MSATIKISDLPVGDVDAVEWLNGFIKSKKITKSDLLGLSVSLQLIIAELMEQVELLSTQMSSTALPNVHDAFKEVSENLKAVDADLDHISPPETLNANDLSDRLNSISELNRARANIELVKQRLSQ